MMADRFKDAIIAIVNELIPERKFLATVEYRVTKSDGGKIEAIPSDDSSGYPQLRSVPVRGAFGANGSTLAEGASVMIAWERGRREAPYIANVLDTPKTFDAKATTSASITAPTLTINNGVQPVARMGDTVAGVLAITSGSPTVKSG